MSSESTAEKTLAFLNSVAAVQQNDDDHKSILESILQSIAKLTDCDRTQILIVDDRYDFGPISWPRVSADGPPLSLSSIDLQADSTDEFLFFDKTKGEAPVFLSKLVSEVAQQAAILACQFQGETLAWLQIELNKGEPSLNNSIQPFKPAILVVASQIASIVQLEKMASRSADSETIRKTGQSLASLSHKIKNIIFGIEGGAHILNDGLQTRNYELITKGWGIHHKNQKRINDLVLDLLLIAGGHELELENYDLNDLISQAIARNRSHFRKNNIQIDWTPRSSESFAEVDLNLIDLALDAIFENSVEACHGREDPQVKIQLTFNASSEEFQLSVLDNGCGIAEDLLPDVFSLYTTSKERRSMGIGLAVVEKISREHDGEVKATSRIDIGTEISLTLPRENQSNPESLRELAGLKFDDFPVE